MTIYQAMQLDVKSCKENIRKACNKKEKRKYALALVLKDIGCVLFAILFISMMNLFFGNASSSAAVVIFCILLMAREIDFGYDIKSSMFHLFLTFLILAVSPCIAQRYGTGIGLCVNLFSVGFLMLTVCRQPLYGGAGLYLFGYLFLYGNPVEGHDFFLRIMEMLAGFLICGTVFWVKHHRKKDREPFSKLLKQFSIFDQVGRWQVQVTLGVVLGIFIGELLHMERIMWMGCSCLTVLSQYGEEPKKRAFQRVGGVIAGSLLFGILYQVWPESMQSMIGVVSGLCLGLCAAYHWKTLLNCFGALIMASSLFGVGPAIVLRIVNNVAGCCFGIFFYYVYHWIMDWLEKKRGGAGLQSAGQ